MDGFIALIVLIVLLFCNVNFINTQLGNMENRKLKSLICTTTNFVIVILFFLALPMVGGYSYSGMDDVIEIFFSDAESAWLPIFAIIGFTIFIIYFSAGAIECQKEIKYKHLKMQIIDVIKRHESSVDKTLSIINQYWKKETQIRKLISLLTETDISENSRKLMVCFDSMQNVVYQKEKGNIFTYLNHNQDTPQNYSDLLGYVKILSNDKKQTNELLKNIEKDIVSIAEMKVLIKDYEI